MSDRTLRAALFYASRGWPVFPVAWQGKEPLILGGFKNAFLDENKIRSTWTAPLYPTNIAIRTGELSKTVVVDCDAKHGGETEFRQVLAELDLDPMVLDTFTVRTGGGGFHFYYEHPGGFIPCRVGLRPGLDIRADGGYVVAPPSSHPSGNTYEITHNVKLAPLPEVLLQWMLRTRSISVGALQEGTDGVVEGGRHDYLFRLGGALRRPGLSEKALSAALHTQNVQLCKPPLPEHEIDSIVRSLARYAPGNPVEGKIQPLAGELPWIKASELMGALFDYLADKDKVAGLPCGMPSLDALLGGGKREGELTAWHAQAKTGKNSVWHKLQHIWLKQGTPIGYASRELSPEFEVLPNLLCLETNTNVWKEPLTPEKREAYEKAIISWPLFFARGYGAMDWQEIDTWVRGLHALGVKHFWFDHLHFMLEDPEDHKSAARMVKSLKVLAQELRVHIDIIIQPNRLEAGEELSMHSLKGGAVINQTVDNLFILKRLEDEDILEIKLETCRSKLARRGKFYLKFDNETMDFVEVKKQYEDVPRVQLTRKGPIAGNFRFDTKRIADLAADEDKDFSGHIP